jgi:hypothetical protein
MLPDDGPSGPKHVGTIERDILSVSCSMLGFNKEYVCWQKTLNLSREYYTVNSLGTCIC